MRVLVTGATGFLGRHLVSHLVERGDEVRALVRARSDAGGLERLGVAPVRGELSPEDVRAAASGCALVFHLAGLVSHERKDLDRLLEVNVAGTRGVLAGAERGARVVHVSSVAALGPVPEPRAVADEGQRFPPWAGRFPYAASKRAGEDVALRAASEGRDVVVANPGFLLGPGDVNHVSTWHVGRYLEGTLRIHTPGGLSNVDARDVAAGLVALAGRGRRGERYILTNREGNLSHRDFFRRVADVTGVRRRMVSVPRAIAWRTPLAPWPLKAGEVRAAANWWFYDPAKAERELGFRTRPLAETLAETAADYLSP
ncbi:MAG: NAD-dependent epimerase/dehydratase family protein [Actinomycetota bacterium]|nr:NAD-dependent epimerase/dehydratase family protein [Actinomycetota bacterium]